MTSDDAVAASKDISERLKAGAERVRGSVGDGMSAAASRASDIAGTMSDTASDLYDRVHDGASSLADRVPGSAGEAVDVGRRAYAKSNDHVARQIGRQPVEALLLAGAIGYLVGWAANRT